MIALWPRCSRCGGDVCGGYNAHTPYECLRVVEAELRAARRETWLAWMREWVAEAVQEQIRAAWARGMYPGWESDANLVRARRETANREAALREGEATP